MLEIAKKEYESGNYGAVEYLHQGFLDISLRPKSVDVVIALFGVFQYILDLNDQLKALNIVYNILNPGGFILFDVMNYFALINKYIHHKEIHWESKSHIYNRKIIHNINIEILP